MSINNADIIKLLRSDHRTLELYYFILLLLFYFILFYFLFYFILFYFILFYFILFYFILFYFILFYFILFYFILFYFILFYFILFYFILFYFILFYFILFYFILFYFILFYFILFYFILFYFIKYLALFTATIFPISTPTRTVRRHHLPYLHPNPHCSPKFGLYRFFNIFLQNPYLLTWRIWGGVKKPYILLSSSSLLTMQTIR